MIIREFNPSDLKRVFEIEKASFKDPYPLGVLKMMYDIGAGFLVAQKNNNVVGYIIFWIQKNNEGHIISLAVDEKYRRQGIGTRLVNSAIKILKKFNVKEVSLEVRKSNKVAIKFYKALGFKKKEWCINIMMMEKTH